MTLDLRGKRVTLIGLGTRQGGLGVARFLAQQGAIVTVTDLRPPEALSATIEALGGLPIRYVLGRHDDRDFSPAGADMIVRNPGVPRHAPHLELARSYGIPIEMEMSLFFQACPAPIIGITGTKGKTSVATLTGDLLRTTYPEAIVAGNMGISALDQLPRLTSDSPIVLEISSWQLEALIEHRLSPWIAVLTLIAEDHLNTYRDFADYASVKRGIGWHQQPTDWLVVNRDDPESWRAATETSATVVPFGNRDAGEDGAWLSDDAVIWRWRGSECHWPLPQSPALQGRHGRRNALAAVAVAMVAGATADQLTVRLHAFPGVRDRMERIAEIDGVTYINDTTATAPIAAAAALESLASHSGRVHLLAGGADKRLDPAPLSEAAARFQPRIYLFEGTGTPPLADALHQRGVVPVGMFTSMDDAVRAATANAAPGDIVLLSPGCASFGLFQDEFDRGDKFRASVAALQQATGASVG